MFAYVKGVLESKNENYIVIDVNGIGYKIFMPNSGINKLPDIGQTVKVHTYYYVREDNISLYGFNTQEELKMFELLISVSGIGTKSALAILSEISPSSFALSVISGDVTSLVKIPGIGNKTAQRMILELKDKLKTEQAITRNSIKNENIEYNNNQDNISEASSALQVLGYTKKEVDKVLSSNDFNGLSIEDIIKEALKKLSN